MTTSPQGRYADREDATDNISPDHLPDVEALTTTLAKHEVIVSTGAGGLTAQPLFASEHHYRENLVEALTTSLTFVLYQAWGGITLDGGVYRVSWDYSVTAENTNKQIDVEIQNTTDVIDLNTNGRQNFDRNEIAMIAGTASGDTVANRVMGFREVTLTAATHSFRFRFRRFGSGGGSNNVRFLTAKLTVDRISA